MNDEERMYRSMLYDIRDDIDHIWYTAHALFGAKGIEDELLVIRNRIDSFFRDEAAAG